ncbi:MAG: RNA polymerase sigma factor [Gemmatimonadota bacterium]
MSLGQDDAATVMAREPTPVNAKPASSGRARAAYADEPGLVKRVQAGDESAFTALVERYMPPAYAVALSLLRSEADAEDGVQESFIRALERIGQLRPGSPFGPWFYRVLRSTCLNLRRRETLRSHEALPAGVSSPASPERDLDRNRARTRVLSALEKLPEMQRLAVLLYDLEGYDHREIAAILEIAEGTSRANLHHGRRSLRQLLKGDEDVR